MSVWTPRREPSRVLRDAEVKFLPKGDGGQFVVVQGGLCEVLGVEAFGDLYQFIIRPTEGVRVRLYLSRLDKNAWTLRLLDEVGSEQDLDLQEKIERRM